MQQKEGIIPSDLIASKIYIIRRLRIMLDRDLVELYGIETKQLKRAAKRNPDRLPSDFMFELTLEEYDVLRSQIGTLKRGSHSNIPPLLLLRRVSRCFLVYLIPEYVKILVRNV